MNYNQQQKKEEKLRKTLEYYRNLKNKISSIKELSDLLGDGYSTSTLQRYFHELYERKIIGMTEYEEICNWLNNNKVSGAIKGGKISQELHSFEKDELGHFTGGKK